MPRIRVFALVFILILTCTFFTTADSFGAEFIHIGVVGAMKFDNGQEMWNGAFLAAEEINKRGGVRVGQKLMKIKLIKADTNEFINVDYAANTMELLLMQNKVHFIVGGFRSEAVLAMQDIAMDYKKIFISVGAALPELTQRVAQNYDRYKYYFRNGVFNSHYLAKACFLQLAYVAQKVKKSLGLNKIKVAIAAEEASWVDGMVAAARQNFPQMGIELAGVFNVSSMATDVMPEIKAIADSEAQIVLTLFSSNVGVAFVTQAADFKLPALQVGINVEAQKNKFWKNTGGKADYVVTTAAFCRDVEITKLTKPFIESYFQRFGEIPSYTASTYTAIAHTLIPAIEQAGTLQPDMLVNIIENRTYDTIQGRYAYEKDKLGRHLHDIKFGADYSILLGVQWQDGELKGIWPKNYREKPDEPPLAYGGIVDLKIPPVVIERHKR